MNFIILKKRKMPRIARIVVPEIPNWSLYLSEPTQKELLERFRKHDRTGRPLGDDDFIMKLEGMTGLSLKKQKPGPKSKN